MTVLLSCSNPMAKQKEISQLTKSVWNDDKSGQERTDKAKKLIEMMDAYIKANPKDTIIPTYLYESARTHIYILGQFPQGLEDLELIVKNHQNNYLAPIALNLKAFTYDETLKEKIKAAQTYSELIQKYPNTKYAKDAEILLQLMNKSDEEIIKMLDEKSNIKKDNVTTVNKN